MSEPMNKEEVIRTFGLDPDMVGNRPRGWSIVSEEWSKELGDWGGTAIPAGSLAVRTRDGASNPISPEACKIANFIGTSEDDFDRTYRDYFYAPLAATVLSRPPEGDGVIGELREALEIAADAIAEYQRYFHGGEMRGSYDGKPERAGLWKAGAKARETLAIHRLRAKEDQALSDRPSDPGMRGQIGLPESPSGTAASQHVGHEPQSTSGKED